MNILKVVLYILCISFCHYAYIKSCSIIFKSKIKELKIKEGLIILAVTLVTYYNTFYNYNFSKILISFISLFIIFKIVFKEENKTTFFKLINIYLLGWIVETLLVAIFIGIFVNNLKQFDSMLVKIPLSILIMLILLLLSYLKGVRRRLIKLYNYMEKTITLTVIMVFFIVVIAILTFYFIITKDVISNISIAFLILIFVLLFILSIIQSINLKKTDEKQEILLNFMKKYEVIIDNERINKHEMLNNLLILKSIKEKNSKDYEEILDEMVTCYKTTKTYSRLYELPPGLKGLFYYKIYDMQENGIDSFIDISNQVIKKIEILNSKDIANLCKILGILLDNAKEGAVDSKEKSVIVDVYEDNNEIVIYIENTINRELQSLNIKNISSKGFSTKGSQRGYGLYLVEETLKRNKNILLEQKIDNKRFVSIIRIK